MTPSLNSAAPDTASPAGGRRSQPFGPAALDPEPWRRYERQMRRVIDHVYRHLDEPLDLNALADVACLSPQHWHRVYRGMTGETLADTVKRLRLHRAAGELAQGSAPLAEVAVRAGYPSLPSFTRTFAAVYGLPPARYRQAGQHRQFEPGRAEPGGAGFEVQVRHFEPLPLLAVEHRGDYMAVGHAFDRLFAAVVGAGLARPGLRMLALYFDDPGRVPAPELRALAAVAGCAEAPAALPATLQATQLPAGPHAVLLHQGPYASMHAAYQWLFGHWLPRSGYQPADGPVVEEYLNSPRDTAPAELRSLIAVPLIAVPSREGRP